MMVLASLMGGEKRARITVGSSLDDLMKQCLRGGRWKYIVRILTRETRGVVERRYRYFRFLSEEAPSVSRTLEYPGNFLASPTINPADRRGSPSNQGLRLDDK